MCYLVGLSGGWWTLLDCPFLPPIRAATAHSCTFAADTCLDARMRTVFTPPPRLPCAPRRGRGT